MGTQETQETVGALTAHPPTSHLWLISQKSLGLKKQTPRSLVGFHKEGCVGLQRTVEGFSLQAWLGPGAHVGHGTALGFIGSAFLLVGFPL